uniref:Uncharacterized protein n=1 Tax=Candidatus Kentrum sp. FM TaxID=2126340 RepID=A0A450TFT0_9GAMM|nr:MAG: hypothetical protein BECKFM1743C_GA0114222_104092 [Candidatus Kentron sp. FM]VFJ66079.1 MAG: hypothetical protein BECKFM1743A_GA0114220_104004 [Candidatus Kentron sp. FM]VFJ73658.1 MAG: hypothetical protein BECKFM1743C_GA0114222_107472 [Candidatus Kentron sp. FM]
MTNLYAWNTARAGSIAHPNVAGRAYSTLQGAADFLACSTNLSPNKKMRPDRCIYLRGCEKISSRSETVPERGRQGAQGPESGSVASYMTPNHDKP